MLPRRYARRTTCTARSKSRAGHRLERSRPNRLAFWKSRQRQPGAGIGRVPDRFATHLVPFATRCGLTVEVRGRARDADGVSV